MDIKHDDKTTLQEVRGVCSSLQRFNKSLKFITSMVLLGSGAPPEIINLTSCIPIAFFALLKTKESQTECFVTPLSRSNFNLEDKAVRSIYPVIPTSESTLP